MRRKDGWLDAVTLRKVMVHLDSGTSIEGLVAASTSDGVVLRAAVLHDQHEQPAEMDGETWVPRERIIFAQGI